MLIKRLIMSLLPSTKAALTKDRIAALEQMVSVSHVEARTAEARLRKSLSGHLENAKYSTSDLAATIGGRRFGYD